MFSMKRAEVQAVSDSQCIEEKKIHWQQSINLKLPFSTSLIYTIDDLSNKPITWTN
jgi:hypothetical protein